MATRLEASERTVYRDVVDLQAQNVPIEGVGALVFGLNDQLPHEALAFCIGMTLTYHRSKITSPNTFQ